MELKVDGRAIREATGIDSDVPTEVIWDVASYRGQSAQIRVVDEQKAAWGHIAVRGFELFDTDR